MLLEMAEFDIAAIVAFAVFGLMCMRWLEREVACNHHESMDRDENGERVDEPREVGK